MLGVEDAVEHRVAQVDVGRRHVDAGPQHARAVGELAGAHAREQVEVLVDRTVAPGALTAGLGKGAAVLAYLVGGEVVDISLAALDELDRPAVQLLEIVRGVVQMLAPSNPSQRTSVWIASVYSCSSLAGLVSSKRRWQRPPNSWAMPKFRQIALAWPM